jgi:hypothetical protein
MMVDKWWSCLDRSSSDIFRVYFSAFFYLEEFVWAVQKVLRRDSGQLESGIPLLHTYELTLGVQEGYSTGRYFTNLRAQEIFIQLYEVNFMLVDELGYFR